MISPIAAIEEDKEELEKTPRDKVDLMNGSPGTPEFSKAIND